MKGLCGCTDEDFFGTTDGGQVQFHAQVCGDTGIAWMGDALSVYHDQVRANRTQFQCIKEWGHFAESQISWNVGDVDVLDDSPPACELLLGYGPEGNCADCQFFVVESAEATVQSGDPPDACSQWRLPDALSDGSLNLAGYGCMESLTTVCCSCWMRS